jgi:hypothetical protein
MAILDTSSSYSISNELLNDPFTNMDSKNLLIILSILESLLAQINESTFSKYCNFNKGYITIRELSEIYIKNRFDKSEGLRGVCFERFVYDSLITKESEITEYILSFLHKLDGLKLSNEIEVILWGDEKGTWIKNPKTNLTLAIISDSDQIYINNIAYNFKTVLKEISYKNQNCGNAGKADLFVKQKNGMFWHGVNVKTNVEDLKMTSKLYKNLDIGVALTTKKINYIRYPENLSNFLKNKCIYVYKNDWNFGEIISIYLTYINELFYEIYREENSTNTNSILSRMPYVFQYLYFYKDISIFQLLENIDIILKRDNIFLPERKYYGDATGSFLINGLSYYSLEKNIGSTLQVI